MHTAFCTLLLSQRDAPYAGVKTVRNQIVGADILTKFKTKPFKHQAKVHKATWNKEYFAYLMEQGTGKSWVLVNCSAQLRRMNAIDLVLIIAPKGVAPGWLFQQYPEHMPDDVAYVAALWKPKSRMTKTGLRNLNAVLENTDDLRVIIMNVESFGMTEDAIDFAIDTLESSNVGVLCAVDESHRIKNPSASSTKKILNNIVKRTDYRRILTGTVADKPFDLFSQFGFLHPSILGTESFVAFKNEYAEMMPADHGLMRHIAQRIPKKWSGRYLDVKWDGKYITESGRVVDKRLDVDGVPHKKHMLKTVTDSVLDKNGMQNEKEMVPAYLPQIVAKDEETGQPKYKNLERLNALIAPHSYRVLKQDCLDIPAKLYNRYYTELTDQQASLYREVSDKHRHEWEDGRLSVYHKMTVYLRLQQIICGYLPTGLEEGELHEIFATWSKNPRIVSTLECLADRRPDEGTIIWCRFVPDIVRLTEALRESYGERSVVQFYGATRDKDRDLNVQRFQGEYIIMGKGGKVLRKEIVLDKDRPRFIIAQPQSGGVGQTWTAASCSFHYSNLFSLIDRLQCEDRPHRIGQKNVVNYIDLECENTIDSFIIAALLSKKNIADIINGDEVKPWL